MTPKALQHIDNPPMPRWFSKTAKVTWRIVAPQVCQWSDVTELDLSGLELMVMAVHHLEQLTTLAEQAGGVEREAFELLRNQYREMLGELCLAYLLGPETLEEITTPRGRTIAELLGAGGGPCHTR